MIAGNLSYLSVIIMSIIMAIELTLICSTDKISNPGVIPTIQLTSVYTFIICVIPLSTRKKGKTARIAIISTILIINIALSILNKAMLMPALYPNYLAPWVDSCLIIVAAVATCNLCEAVVSIIDDGIICDS